MFCEKCGAVLSDDARFCSECGAKVDKVTPKTIFCTKCGKEYPCNQMFCTSCGNRLDVSEEIAVPERNTSDGCDSNSEQVFTSMFYAPGEVTGFSLKAKQCSILFRENQIEVYKVDTTGFVFGGAIGGLIIGAVEGAKLASGGSWKKPNAVIPYANIVRFRPGKCGANASVILNLNDCTSYTFVVGAKQEQIRSILRGKCPGCETAGVG